MAFGGRSQLKMSDETFDFVCTTCAQTGKTVEAVKYCVDCSEYCCQSCTDTHKIFPALKNHNLLDISQGSQASGHLAKPLEIPTERCSIHVAKVLDMYCEGHDVVGCSTCFVLDHKSCPGSHIHSIPDMIDTIFKLSDCKQNHSLLKDMMVSMATVSKSKDTQLLSLNKTKKEALDKVATFQKALEALVRKAAESSRQEVETVYKELKTEVLQDKLTVDGICHGLQTADEKLTQSEGNRAQKFVCSKLAQEKVKEAGIEKMKHELQHHSDLQISFIPDQSSIEYLKALQGIGQVQKHGKQTYNIYKKQKDDLYKIKESRVINIKLSADTEICAPSGLCLTHDNQLLVSDLNNNKLKRIDTQKMSVIDYCTVDSGPWEVCRVSKHEVAVACYISQKIQFISVQGTMSPTREIKLSHRCYSVAFNDGKLYVTNCGYSLYMYDMTGNLLKTISKDDTGNKLFKYSRHVTFSGSGNKMFVGGGHNGVVCFDGVGEYLSTITDSDLLYADGVCVDGRGNVFGVGYTSHNVIQFSEDGKKVGVVVKKDELQYPRSVCYHQELKRMFVISNGDVKMFVLE